MIGRSQQALCAARFSAPLGYILGVYIGITETKMETAMLHRDYIGLVYVYIYMNFPKNKLKRWNSEEGHILYLAVQMSIPTLMLSKTEISGLSE